MQRREILRVAVRRSIIFCYVCRYTLLHRTTLLFLFAFFICYMLQYDIEGFYGWSDFKKGLKSGASLAEHATGIDKAEKLAKETEK